MIAVWDATSLITCAKFQVDGRLVLDWMLDAGKMVIAETIRQEAVDAGLAGGYPDAVEIKARLDAGVIEVRDPTLLSAPFEELL